MNVCAIRESVSIGSLVLDRTFDCVRSGKLFERFRWLVIELLGVQKVLVRNYINPKEAVC
jgi:hypothetical protein